MKKASGIDKQHTFTYRAKTEMDLNANDFFRKGQR